MLQGATAVALNSVAAKAQGKATESGPRAGDRVFLTNEDSNTLSVIDPVSDALLPTVNLTSFDDDSRPPFRFVTGNVTPTHGEMVQKPLYHGAISIHGCVPSPDSRMFATAGRGTSNLYLVDTAKLKVIGNQPNPQAGPTTSQDILTSGILVGREPHEPTFTRNGKEVWVALRGENKIAVIDVQRAGAESSGELPRGAAIRRFVPVLPGPAMTWFSARGEIAFLISQKMSRIEVFHVKYDAQGFSTTERKATIDTSAQDRFAFAPFLKITPDGRETEAKSPPEDRKSLRHKIIRRKLQRNRCARTQLRQSRPCGLQKSQKRTSLRSDKENAERDTYKRLMNIPPNEQRKIQKLVPALQ